MIRSYNPSRKNSDNLGKIHVQICPILKKIVKPNKSTFIFIYNDNFEMYGQIFSNPISQGCYSYANADLN